MRRSARDKQAGVKDVAEKIYRHFRDLTITKQLVERVQHFLQTKNDRDDLPPEQQAAIYWPYDYGEKLPLTKHRQVDLQWSNHARYRSDLRDVSWKAVNESVRDWLHERLVTKGPDAKSVRMKLPGTGTAVVDYDLERNPARAKVITVWASRMASVEQAIEAAFTGSELRLADDSKIRFQAVFMMGLTGAGKSTVKARQYLTHAGFVDIDADAIKEKSPDYNPERPHELHEWSKAVAAQQLRDTIATGDPFIYDGTGTSADHVKARMDLARFGGYRIFLVYVYVPVTVALFRNRNRPRFVPEEVVIRKAGEISRSFRELSRFADKTKVVANFTPADEQAANRDVELYPPPHPFRPPRPGDADYGQSKAATGATAVNQADIAEQVASAYLASRTTMKTFWLQGSANRAADQQGLQTQEWLNRKQKEFEGATGVKWSWEPVRGGFSFAPEDSGVSPALASIEEAAIIAAGLKHCAQGDPIGYASYLALAQETDIKLPRLMALCKGMEKQGLVRRSVNRMGKPTAVKLAAKRRVALRHVEVEEWLLERICSSARTGVTVGEIATEAKMWEYDLSQVKAVLRGLMNAGQVHQRGGKLWPDPDVVRRLVSKQEDAK